MMYTMLNHYCLSQFFILLKNFYPLFIFMSCDLAICDASKLFSLDNQLFLNTSCTVHAVYAYVDYMCIIILTVIYEP